MAVWVMGGGKLLRPFIRERLIDEIIITIAPILLGGGVPLFRDTELQTQLSLRTVTRYNQFITLHYDVVK